MFRLLRATALALAGAWLAAAPAHAEPPAIQAFFKRPALRSPLLSPSGRYLAVQSVNKGDRMVLAVVDLVEMSPPRIVAGFSDADVSEHHWVNENRLVFGISNSGDGDNRVANPGLWGVDRDGANLRPLIQTQQSFITAATHIRDRRLDANFRFLRTLPDGGDDVLVVRHPWSNESEDRGVQCRAWTPAPASCAASTRGCRHRSTPGSPTGRASRARWRPPPRAVPRPTAATATAAGRSGWTTTATSASSSRPTGSARTVSPW